MAESCDLARKLDLEPYYLLVDCYIYPDQSNV